MFRCLLPFNITAPCTAQAVASIARSLQCKLFTMILPLSLVHHWIVLTVYFSSRFWFFFPYIVVGGCTLYLNITFNFLLFHCDTPAHRILSLLKYKYTAYIYGYDKKKLVFSTKQPTENVQMKWDASSTNKSKWPSLINRWSIFCGSMSLINVSLWADGGGQSSITQKMI